MKFNDVTIKTKLYAMTGLSAVGLMMVLGLSVWCLDTFRVNGPVHREIAGGTSEDVPRIVVRTRGCGDGGAAIEVEDNGPGMSEGIRSRVFEPFFTTTSPQSGSGLGLFISYCIVTRTHGGAIGVESVEGMGTRFVIKFPARKEP